MPQITCVISFFCRFSHDNDQKGSVPWCHRYQIFSTFFKVFHMKSIETVQYHDATNDMLYLNFFMVFPMKITKTAQYHDATNSRIYLQFSWYFPWNASKRLSTTMLQMTCSISIFSWHFPCNSPKQLSTMMLQIARIVYFSHDIFHPQNGSVPWCYK